MKVIKEIIPYVVIILIVVLIRLFVITPVTVDGNSMDDTLKNGDIMLLNKLTKNHINRNDIVVFYHRSDRLIKRVIALPGEKVKCVSGIIYVNNEEYEDNYGNGTTKDFQEYILGDDEYFVMGDNRSVSLDSRAFGPVKKDAIQGKASFVIFPFTRIRFA